MKILQKKRHGRFFVKYFNGFSLKGEEKIFASYLDTNDFTLAGFSYGAQCAFERAYSSQSRVEKLILLSPAFFQPHKRAFVRTQLRYFTHNNKEYIEQFLLNVASPSTIDLHASLAIGTKEELEALLTYQWDKKKIQELLERGVNIEVYLGEEDKIMSATDAYSFFSNLTTTYLIKDRGHCLH